MIYLVGGIRTNRLKKYVKMSTTKSRSPLRFVLGKIESRLDFILYRINVIQSPVFIKKFILYGYTEVNEEVESRVNFIVKKNIKIDFKLPNYNRRDYEIDFEEAILRRLIFKPSTDYLETSYTTFRSIMHNLPNEDTTFYPFDFKPFYFFRLYN